MITEAQGPFAPLEKPHRDELRNAAEEFATLGSGNHFVEIQADEDGRLWLMVHSGSRALGQAIRNHHLSRAQPLDNRFRAFDAESVAGTDYLHDAACARRGGSRDLGKGDPSKSHSGDGRGSGALRVSESRWRRSGGIAITKVKS